MWNPMGCGTPRRCRTLWDVGPPAMCLDVGRNGMLELNGMWDPTGCGTQWDVGPNGMWDPTGCGTQWDVGPLGFIAGSHGLREV